MATFLKAHGYEWLLEQVDGELKAGRITEERINTLSEVRGAQYRIDLESEFKRGIPAEFVKRSEYSPAEAVVLLLEAARRAILDPGAMVDEMAKTLSSDGISEIQFQSDDNQGAPIEMSLKQQSPHLEALARASKFDEIIRDVRERS